ncbi:MAG TPA: hypothetical protein VFV96_14755 [Verrucomicrobiae bacterium]|nr:hypothetical protein [Verrucomicrobiae bacterium]
MSIEALLWGILPTMVALCAVIVSLFVACRARRVLHFVASAVVIGAVAWSLLILYRIFILGAWPTYLPHLAIGVALFIVMAQTFLFRSKRHDVV